MKEVKKDSAVDADLESDDDDKLDSVKKLEKKMKK
jgi:hypothetical protein